MVARIMNCYTPVNKWISESYAQAYRTFCNTPIAWKGLNGVCKNCGTKYWRAK